MFECLNVFKRLSTFSEIEQIYETFACFVSRMEQMFKKFHVFEEVNFILHISST